MDWLDLLMSDSQAFHLPACKYRRGKQTFAHGCARISWGSDFRFHLHGFSDGGEKLSEALLQRLTLGNGELVPRDAYLSVAGSTYQGGILKTMPILPFDGYSAEMGSPHVIWEFDIPGFVVSRGSRTNVTSLRMLLGPCGDIWTDSTHTTITDHLKNVVRRISVRDLFHAHTSLGQIRCRRRSDDWMDVELRCTNEISGSAETAIVGALRRSFGFLFGRRTILRGYEVSGPRWSKCTAYSSQSAVSRNYLPPPVGLGGIYGTSLSALLGLAVPFFYSETGMRIARYLEAFWDALDNDITTRTTVANVALEGLLHEIGVARVADSPDSETELDRDIARLTALVDDPGSGLSRRFATRIKSVVGSFRNERPQDTLNRWKAGAVLGVDERDIEAWKRTRNLHAHGGAIGLTPDPSTLQRRVDDFYQLLSLLNRVLLNLMGYQGKYLDRMGMERPFPFSELL